MTNEKLQNCINLQADIKFLECEYKFLDTLLEMMQNHDITSFELRPMKNEEPVVVPREDGKERFVIVGKQCVFQSIRDEQDSIHTFLEQAKEDFKKM